MNLQQLEAHRNAIATDRQNARRAARRFRIVWTDADDSIEGCRMTLNACYLHRALGSEGFSFAALRAWARRNVVLLRVKRAALLKAGL